MSPSPYSPPKMNPAFTIDGTIAIARELFTVLAIVETSFCDDISPIIDVASEIIVSGDVAANDDPAKITSAVNASKNFFMNYSSCF